MRHTEDGINDMIRLAERSAKIIDKRDAQVPQL